MAQLWASLGGIVRFREDRADQYEAYLQRIADLAKRLDTGHDETLPSRLDSPGKRALYNNLMANPALMSAMRESSPDYDGKPVDEALALALKLDEIIRVARPDGWRGVRAKEQVIKAAMFEVLRDVNEVERLFLIVSAQTEY